MTVVKVGEQDIRLEPFSARKAIRIIRTIEAIAAKVPELLDEWGAFATRYETSNVREYDRATARSRYAPEPLMDEEPVLVDGKALTDGDGNVIVKRTPKLDEKGRPVMGPDPLGHMTEQDWEASGQKLRLPKSPTVGERVAAIFPKALDVAETQTLRVVALIAMPERELKQAVRAGLDEALDGLADDLLDAPAEDLIELAVAAGEMVEDQFVSKVKALGDRLPNALRLFGFNLGSPTTTSSDTETSRLSSSETRPTSSTDSPTRTDGPSEPSSELAGSSSSPSDTA